LKPGRVNKRFPVGNVEIGKADVCFRFSGHR
jgi:hypothetical protein